MSAGPGQALGEEPVLGLWSAFHRSRKDSAQLQRRHKGKSDFKCPLTQPSHGSESFTEDIYPLLGGFFIHHCIRPTACPSTTFRSMGAVYQSRQSHRFSTET